MSAFELSSAGAGGATGPTGATGPSGTGNIDDAVILAPASSARNVIQPTAGAVIAAIVKAHAAQSVDLTQWQTSAGAVLVSIGPTGAVAISPSGAGAPDTFTDPALRIVGKISDYFGDNIYQGFQVVQPGYFPASGNGGMAIHGYVNTFADQEFGLMEMYQRSMVDGNVTGFTNFGPGLFLMSDYDWALASNVNGQIAFNLGDPDGAALTFFSGTTSLTETIRIHLEGFTQLHEITAPAAPAADNLRYFARDSGGKTQFCVQFATGAIHVLGTQDGGAIYVVGGTDVALADGGTGASLVDPNADRIMFWDDSAGAVTWLTPGTNLSITGTTLDATNDSALLPWTIDVNPATLAAAHTNWDTVIIDARLLANASRESSGAQNASFEWDEILAAGTWSLEINSFKGGNLGVITVAFDGTDVGTIDLYAAALTGNNRQSLTGISVAATGKKRIRFKMATKNASSSNYFGEVSWIRLLRTA